MAKVLLVDDNGSVLLTLAIALRRHGHVVTIAVDGFAALQELKADTFDALVSDVRMPGLMGPELAAHARALQPSLRIILTSAYPSVDSPVGIEAFLRKPIDIEQLHTVLASPPASSDSSPAPEPPSRSRPGPAKNASAGYERPRDARHPAHHYRTAHA